jgi:RPM1-interacting protein 4
MNPNDPEENPEAFMQARGGMEDDVDFSSGAYQGITAEHHNIDQRLKGHNAHGTRSANDHQKSASHNSITSESGSEKSSSEGNKALSSSRHSRQRSRSTHSTNHDGVSLLNS